jgi:ATP-dependent helicase HrpA
MDYKEVIAEYTRSLPVLRASDRKYLANLEHQLKQRIANGLPADRMLAKFHTRLNNAVKRSLHKITDRMKISLPPELPVSMRADEIGACIRDNPVVIVCGATGSGKTTQLPKIALLAGRGQDGLIGCTQPRRIAAVSMAARVADELNCRLGEEIGYKVRFDDSTSSKTLVKFMTDGILLAETISDKELEQYDTLIIDEAHERSLNIDFILGYLKNLLKVRPDLKVIISSATLDAENFAAFFDNAPVVEVEGRTYPVEDFFLEPDEDEDLASHVLRGIRWIYDIDREGDILVFLPGEREIKETADVLNGQQWRNTDILPLYARMGISEQRRIFEPGANRRIILATNVAETSITIPRIHYVVDSGQVRISRFNPGNQVQELKVEQVSRASAMQRRGRCGRIAEGGCVFLYDRKTFEDSPEFTDPEIRRSSLGGVILQMASLGLPPIEEFPLIDPPQTALVREGYRMLQNILAMDKRKTLTRLGREIAAFPVDPHLAAMICRGVREKVAFEMLVICSFLSIMDPRERPQEKQQAADQAHAQWNDEKSDFISILKLWNFIQDAATSQTQLRKLCKKNFLNFRRVREWYNLFMDLRDALPGMRHNVNMPENMIFKDFHYAPIHRSLLAGIPTHIAKYDRENKLYRGAKNRKFYIFPGSGLFRKTPEWIISFELVSTTKLYARKVAEMDPAWVEEVAPHLCKSTYGNVRWNPEKGFVYASETLISSGLIVHAGRAVHYGKVCPDEARRIFIREGVTPGNMHSKAEWLKLHRNMLKRMELLEIMLRRPGYLIDTEAIYEYFDKLIPADVCSVKSLENWIQKSRARIAMRLEDAVFDHAVLPELDDYPDILEFCGETFKLSYKFDPGESDDGVTLLCPEDLLNLLPEYCSEWCVPGFIAEKIPLLIRSLPKTVRTLFNPATETAERFCVAVKAGEINTAQPLAAALAEFLSGLSGERVRSYDFDMERIPLHLTMKIAEIDKSGKVLRITAGMPERSGVGSQVSIRLKGAGDWIVSGTNDWPAGDMPESIVLEEHDNTTAYPALADEGESVGRQVFLDQREADAAHNHGLIRLYRLRNADNIKYFKRNLPLSTPVKLSLCLNENRSYLPDDFLDAAILAALSDDGGIIIRTKAVYLARETDTRERLLQEYLKYYAGILENIVIDKDRIEQELHNVNDQGRFFYSIEDINGQLDFLFRPGFLKDRTVFRDYPRYLKALRLRVERMLLNPSKDGSKMEPVEYFQERFRIALGAVEDYTSAFELKDFSALLQEFRIACFAPEIGLREKVSEKKLLTAWDAVKL